MDKLARLGRTNTVHISVWIWCAFEKCLTRLQVSSPLNAEHLSLLWRQAVSSTPVNQSRTLNCFVLFCSYTLIQTEGSIKYIIQDRYLTELVRKMCEKNNKHKNATVPKAIAELLRLDFTAVLNNVAPQLITYWGLVPIPAYITSKKKEQTNMLSKSGGYQIKGYSVVYRIQNNVKSSKTF